MDRLMRAGVHLCTTMPAGVLFSAVWRVCRGKPVRLVTVFVGLRGPDRSCHSSGRWLQPDGG